jgi:hypothetical protein
MSISVAAAEIIERYPITQLLPDLGFELPRRGTRTKCVLCGSNGLSFSFHADRGIWHCFRCGESGGKIALVRRALNIEPCEALKWMAARQGLELHQQTPAEKRAYQIRSKAAEVEAGALVAWREDMIAAITEKRDETMAVYYQARRYLVTHPASEAGTCAWECACLVDATYWPRVEDLDRALDRLRTADYGVLLPLYRRRQLRRAA